MEYCELIIKITGIGSLLLFLVANAYYPVRLIANQFRYWPGGIVKFLNRYRDIHMWLNVAALALMTINAYFASDKSLFLYVSLLVTVWLALAGILGRLKKFSADAGKQKRFLHAQQTAFAFWLVLLTLGIL